MATNLLQHQQALVMTWNRSSSTKNMVSLDGWVMKCNATERKTILSFDRFLTAFEISPQASP